MAETPTLMDQVEHRLHMARLMLDDLVDVDADWPRMSSSEQASWCVDWLNELGGVRLIVDPAYRAGWMTADQVARYEAYLRDLQAGMPIIERLRLDPPAFSLELRDQAA